MIHSFDSVKEMIQSLHEFGSQTLSSFRRFGQILATTIVIRLFAACIEAGGWAGLKRLQQSLSASNDLFGLHDQYRDYYYTAKTHNENEAIQLEDGGV